MVNEKVCDVPLGYYALALCILKKNYTPERAFSKLTSQNTGSMRKDISITDVESMIRLKETMTYKQIGELYGLRPDAVYSRIRRYKKRQREAI